MKARLSLYPSLSRRQFVAGISGLTVFSIFNCRPAYVVPPTSDELVAETEYGKVRGRMLGNVKGFLGMPYGAPTGGQFRFLPPRKPAAWRGIRECVKAGPRAVQASGTIFTDPIIGQYFCGGRADGPALTSQPDSENCLVLNVLTPSTVGNRPVLVYIHGGGFAVGSGALTVLCDRFVSESDTVLVGVNHRLNVFGYSFLGDMDSRFADSGNAGQLDLVAALRWVRDNIANFGGDSTNVTVFGESGGGAKISTLLSMPDAKGLFHRAVIESSMGTNLTSRAAASETTRKVLAALGLSPKRVSDLQSLPARSLLSAATSLGELDLGPVADGRSVPYQAWERGAPAEAAGVDLLIGSCKDESTLFLGHDDEAFSLDWSTLKRRLLAEGIPQSAIEPILAAYRKDYPTDTPSDTFFRLSSDRGARTIAMALAEAKLTQANGKVYVYHFEWNTPVMGGEARAFHTAELPLAMRLVRYLQAEELSKQIAGAWAGFARNGNPNHSNLPNWEPFSAEKRASMIFDVGRTRMIYDPACAEMRLLKPFPSGTL